MSAVAHVAKNSRLRPTRLPPRIRKPLRADRNGLPIPPVKILVRDTHPCRLSEHYFTTVQEDMMYLTYKHETGPRPPPRIIRPTYDPDNPYTKNRINPPIGGDQSGNRIAPPSSPENVVKLEKISLHCMLKEALTSRSNLLGPIAAFRALAGETEGGGGRRTSEGVQIVRGKKTVAGWIRPGIPVGVKVDLKGPKMYDFLGMLVEFVLPRLRDFNGIIMPAASANMKSPSAVSGVVSFGLPPEAFGYFPQIEVNIDAYPKSYGMHIHFVTNAEGYGAQNRARALLSGFQVPFAKK